MHSMAMLRPALHTKPFSSALRKSVGVSPRRTVVAAAKKEKKGAQQKSSAFANLLKAKEQAVTPPEKQTQAGSAEPAAATEYGDPELLMFHMLLAQNYWRTTKSYLLAEGVEFDVFAETLYKAPFALLVHDKYETPERQVILANRRALLLLETTWAQLINSPSSKIASECSAKPEDPFFGDVASSPATLQGYEPLLVSSQGKTFRVKDGLIFNVNSTQAGGLPFGQVLYFNKYELEDGTLVIMGPDGDEVILPVSKLPAELERAEAAVVQQAEVVRNLKEGQGLPNTDPQVQDGVKELNARKERVNHIKQRMEDAAKAAEAPEAAPPAA